LLDIRSEPLVNNTKYSEVHTYQANWKAWLTYIGRSRSRIDAT